MLIDKLWIDSITEEVRNAGADLAKECNYDIHEFSQMLSKNQLIREQEGWKLVDKDELETIDISNLH